ncbi:MAG: biotin/lipoyl-binding protein [Planctomycetota bacterium]
MSSDHASVNSQTVEQTKQQIRSLVGEIAQLSKSDVDAEEYYAAFMQRIVSALAAVGGAVWLLGEGNRPELAYQINLSESLLRSGSDESTRHLRLLNHIARSGEPQLVPPMSGTESEEAGGNPTSYLLVLAPLTGDNSVEGVIEVFQRPDSQPATQRGYLRFLIQMCELASEWLKSRKLRHFTNRHSLWAQADQFARMVHDNLDVRETAYTIANEGRRLIGCDRVSVAIKRGRVCKVEAISGQDTIETRSNLVTALGKVATRVVATGDSLWYEGNTEDFPPQVEEAIDEYVDESYSKNVIVLPFRKPGNAEEMAAGAHNPEMVGEVQVDREIVGALIVEQIETDLPREILEPRVDLVYEHSTRALSNAINVSNVFLMPLWRTIGKSSLLVKGKNLPKTAIVGAVIVAVILALCLIPTDFNLKGDGVLQPLERRDVFFDVDGRITEVTVDDGGTVEEGDPLVKLENHELSQEYQRIVGQMSETSERLDSLRRAKRNPMLDPSQEAQFSGEYMQLQQRQKNLQLQLELIQRKRENLIVRSPMAGQVLLPWDAEQSLLRRPVMAGQRVMTIAKADPEDLQSEWEIKLAMPERRMGHIRRAMAELGPELEVAYVTTADPRSSKKGTLKRVARMTDVKGEEGPTVELIVEIDREDLYEPSPGTTVTAKVMCGRCSLGYSWFHEAIEWVQKHIVF